MAAQPRPAPPRCPRALRAPRAPPVPRAPPASAAPASRRPLVAAANKGGLVCSPAAAASPGAVLRAAPWSPVQPWPASAPGPPAVPPRPPSWGRARGRGCGCRQHPGWTPGARPGSARTPLALDFGSLQTYRQRRARGSMRRGGGGSAEGPRATGTVKNKVSSLQCVRPLSSRGLARGEHGAHTRDPPAEVHPPPQPRAPRARCAAGDRREGAPRSRGKVSGRPAWCCTAPKEVLLGNLCVYALRLYSRALIVIL